MSAEEYGAILGRLDGLERQVRWRHVERLLMLSLVSWLLASGSAATSVREGWQSLRARSTSLSLRDALRWSLAGVRDLARVRPAVDLQTVAEDAREASEAIATVTRPSFIVRPSRSGAGPHGLTFHPSLSSGSSSVKPAPRDGAVPNFAGGRSPFAGPNASAPARFVPSVMPSRGRPDLEASIRDAERSLARASEGAPKLAEFGPGLPSVVARPAKNSNFDRSVPAVLPTTEADLGSISPIESQLTPAAAAPAPNSATAHVPVAGAPTIALKALGYAQSVDGAQAVLTDGTTLYVVNEGEEFADRFCVTGISPEGLDIEDRRTNTTFQLAFGH